jgi:hypothetical protein
MIASSVACATAAKSGSISLLAIILTLATPDPAAPRGFAVENARKRSPEPSPDMSKVCLVGPHSTDWAPAMLTARWIAEVRVLQGLLSLANRHAPDDVERACEVALSYGASHLRPLRQLMRRHAAKQQPLPVLNEHPLIRPLADDGQWLQDALAGSRGKGRGPSLPLDPQPYPHLRSSSCLEDTPS